MFQIVHRQAQSNLGSRSFKFCKISDFTYVYLSRYLNFAFYSKKVKILFVFTIFIQVDIKKQFCLNR
jgi:hypothetical protein